MRASFLWQAAEKAFQPTAWREDLHDPAENGMASRANPKRSALHLNPRPGS
jgi:hypothetical protein